MPAKLLGVMIRFFYFLAFVFFVFSTQAQVGPAVDGQAGAGLGGVSPMESPSVNPAAIALLNSYYVGLQHFSGDVGVNTSLSQQSIVLTDGTKQGFATGSLFYRRRKFDVNGVRVKEDMFVGSLSKPLNDHLSVGVSGYQIKTDNGLDGTDYDQSNFDLSLMWLKSKHFSVGVKTQALLGSDGGASFIPSRVLPRTGVGVQYFATNLVILRGDLYYDYERNPDDSFSHHLGVELLLRANWRFRSGISIDDVRSENRYALGIGWEGPRLRFGYSYQNEYRQDYGGAHSIDIYLNL